MKVCKVDGCGRKVQARGWCSTHYSQWHRSTGSDERDLLRKPQPPTCTIEGCDQATNAHGWCATHYTRWRTHGDPLAESVIVGDDERRFWAKVDKTSTCWLWTGQISGDGYGQFAVGRRMAYAHRWAFEAKCGPVANGLQLDHLCRVRNCVRPAHLEPVPQKVNVLRGVGWGAENARKDECNHGHPLSGDNLRIDRRGHRVCRACAARRNQEYRRRQAAESVQTVKRG